MAEGALAKLFDELAPGAAPDYLSGLLIGHELISATAWLAEQNAGKAPLVLIGEGALLTRYRAALAAFDGAAWAGRAVFEAGLAFLRVLIVVSIPPVRAVPSGSQVER